MLRALALALLVATSADASPRIHTTSAAGLQDQERTLRAELVRSLADVDLTVDASLVTLSETIESGELLVTAEVRALVSDKRGAARWASTARAAVRGAPRSRAQLRHDAVIEATRALATTIRARL